MILTQEVGDGRARDQRHGRRASGPEPTRRHLHGRCSLKTYALERESVAVTGALDSKTIEAIRRFQGRFITPPDARVPGGRTMLHLNDGSASNCTSSNAHKRVVIDRAVIEA